MRREPIRAEDVQAVEGATVYPEPFATLMAGRLKRKLGDLFGLRNFGVNLTRLRSGAASALVHCHARQDEFVFVLSGHPTLIHGDRQWRLSPGDCMGFAAGTGIGHRLINHESEPAVFLEIGDRTPGDEVRYPDDDLVAFAEHGTWRFTHRDGAPY